MVSLKVAVLLSYCAMGEMAQAFTLWSRSSSQTPGDGWQAEHTRVGGGEVASRRPRPCPSEYGRVSERRGRAGGAVLGGQANQGVGRYEGEWTRSAFSLAGVKVT